LNPEQIEVRKLHVEQNKAVQRGERKEEPISLCSDGSVLTCFEWLALETGWVKKRFNSCLIDETW
jgi:hypothetical protein